MALRLLLSFTAQRASQATGVQTGVEVTASHGALDGTHRLCSTGSHIALDGQSDESRVQQFTVHRSQCSLRLTI